MRNVGTTMNPQHLHKRFYKTKFCIADNNLKPHRKLKQTRTEIYCGGLKGNSRKGTFMHQ